MSNLPVLPELRIVWELDPAFCTQPRIAMFVAAIPERLWNAHFQSLKFRWFLILRFLVVEVKVPLDLQTAVEPKPDNK